MHRKISQFTQKTPYRLPHKFATLMLSNATVRPTFSRYFGAEKIPLLYLKESRNNNIYHALHTKAIEKSIHFLLHKQRYDSAFTGTSSKTVRTVVKRAIFCTLCDDVCRRWNSEINYKRLPMNICFSNSTSLIIGLLTFAVVKATGDYFYNLAARVPFYVTYSDNTPAVNRHLLWKIILPKVLLSSFGNFSPVKTLWNTFFSFVCFSCICSLLIHRSKFIWFNIRH